MASCSIIKNPTTGEIIEVLASNGNPSSLYRNALSITTDPAKALTVWASVYTNTFKMKYGDWEKGESTIALDTNGEPTIDVVMHLPVGINNIIQTEFAAWESFQPGTDGWSKEGTVLKFMSKMRKKYPDIRMDMMRNESLPGLAKVIYLPSYKSLKVKFSKAEIKQQKVEVNKVMDYLVPKFPDLTYEWVKPSSLKQEDHYWDTDKIRSFVKDNKIYLVEGRVLPEDGIEEFTHVFVEMLRQNKPNLFKGLFDSIVDDPKYAADYINISQWYKARYKGPDVEMTIKSEFLAKSLAKALKGELEVNPEGRPTTTFGKLIQRFLDWLGQLFDMKTIVPGQALSEIAGYINSADISMDLPIGTYLYYSADPDANLDPDDKDDNLQQDPANKFKTARQLNIEKGKEALEKLKIIKKLIGVATQKQAQIAVVDTLINNITEKITALQNDVPFISVTKYMGSQDTENTNSKSTEIGSNFGNFFHYLLEDIQMEYATSGVAPIIIYSKDEFFDAFYEKNKSLLGFKNLDKNIIKSIGLEMVSYVNTLLREGKVLLPEVEIGVTDVDGKLVLGRLDLMTVDKNGVIEVVDLKTKTAIGPPTKEFPTYLFRAAFPFDGSYKEGVDPVFEQFKTKSDLDKYHMQLKIYAEMLRKLGLTVEGTNIFAISYNYTGNTPDKKNSTEFTLNGYNVHSFTQHDFYQYDSQGKLTGNGQTAVKIDNAVESRFREPVEMQEEQTTTEAKVNPFALLNKEDQDNIIASLLKLSDEQLDIIDKERKKAEVNTELSVEDKNAVISRLTKRMAGITSIKEKINSGFTSDTAEGLAVAKATVIKLALDVFSNEIQTIKEKINALDIPSTYEIGNLQNNNVLRELQQYTTTLDNLGDYIDLFKSTVLSLSTLDVSSKTQIIEYLGSMTEEIAIVSSSYVNMGKSVMKSVILKTISKDKFEGVFGDMKKILQPKLNWINKTIAKIEAGETSPETWSYSLLRQFSKLLGGKTNQADRLTALKEEAVRIQGLLKKNILDETTLDDYLEGIINNPDSSFYMGQTMSGNDSIISMDQLIGDSANSEMAISSMFQYMRNITEDGKNEFLNWTYETNTDALTSNFINASGGVNAANKMISEEVVRETEFDETGKVTKSMNVRQYLDAVSPEYYNTHNKYKSMLRGINKKIIGVNKSIKETAPSAILDALLAEKTLLREQEGALSLEYVNWLIAKSQTKVKPEIMMLMRGSGVFNSEITERYDQIHKIVLNAGGIEKLSNEEQEDIDALEAEVSRIKQEMLEQRPDLEEKMKSLIDNFEFDPNYNLWTKLREQIVKQNDPAVLKRWDMNNSDEVPTEEYEKKVTALYDALSEFSEEDPILEGLKEKKRKIKAKNKVRGIFNVKYMTEEDIANYEKIEEEIKKRNDERKDRSDLTPEQILIVKSLGARLSSLQQKVLSDSYTRERDRLIERVQKAYKILKDLEKELKETGNINLSRQITDANNDYLKCEDQFAAFFNKYNNTKYELNKNNLVERRALNEQPKSFVYVYRPINPNDLELVPSKKYRIRRLKEAAYNPDYQQSFVKEHIGGGMYPMPKGFKFNKVTNRYEISAGAEYVNSRYLELQKNQVAYDFYTKLVIENFVLKQREASGQPLGYAFPFVNQLGLESVLSKGAEGVAREFKQKMQEVTYQGSAYEKATNESGMTGTEKIKFPENSLMPADLTTTNGIEAIMNWNSGFYVNKKLATSSVEMSAILDYLNNIKERLVAQKGSEDRVRKIDTIIKQVDFNRKKFIYGQLYKEDKAPMKVFNRKTARMMMHLASFGRMAFDVPMQFGNLLAGNVQAFLSTSSSRHADTSDYLAAKRMIYTRWFPSMLADWGKVSDISLETMIFRYMNPSGKDLHRVLDANTANKARRLANRIFNVTDLSMGLQDKGELEIALTTMLMIMNNKTFEVFESDANGDPIVENGVKKIKRDADGNTVYVNAIEVFAKYNGAIGLRKDVNVSADDMSNLKGTIMTEIYRFQGNYSAYTKTRFGSTLIGSLYEYYRKYLVPAVSTRFSFGGFEGVGSAYSWDTGEAYMGWYIALGKMYQYYGLGKASKTLLYDTLLPGFVKKAMPLNDAEMNGEEPEYYRSRAAMAGREVLFAIAFYMLYQALRTMIQESDDDDLSYAELMLIRSLVKVTNESRSLVPAPIFGKPGDYVDNFGQFTTAFREGKTLWSLSENAIWYADYAVTGSTFAYERGFYQRDAGRYEEGDAKILKNLNDLSSISNIQDVFDPRLAAEKAVVNK